MSRQWSLSLVVGASITLLAILIGLAIIDLGELMRPVDGKTLIGLERGCIGGPNYVSHRIKQEIRVQNPMTNQLQIEFYRVGRQYRIEWPRSYKRAVREACYSERLRDGDSYWEVLGASVNNGKVSHFDTFATSDGHAPRDACVNEVAARRSKPVKAIGIVDGRVKSSICIKHSNGWLKVLRKDARRPPKKKRDGEDGLALLASIREGLSRVTYHVREPKIFGFAKVSVALHDDGKVDAVLVFQKYEVDDAELSHVINLIGDTVFNLEDPWQTGPFGIWVDAILDFQGEELRIGDIDRIRPYGRSLPRRT